MIKSVGVFSARFSLTGEHTSLQSFFLSKSVVINNFEVKLQNTISPHYLEEKKDNPKDTNNSRLLESVPSSHARLASWWDISDSIAVLIGQYLNFRQNSGPG